MRIQNEGILIASFLGLRRGWVIQPKATKSGPVVSPSKQHSTVSADYLLDTNEEKEQLYLFYLPSRSSKDTPLFIVFTLVVSNRQTP